MKRSRMLLAVLLAVPLFATDLTPKEERLQTLKFGIETEIIDLVRTLQQEKNRDFLDELAGIFRSARNTDLKELLLGYFLDLKDNHLENDAIKELSQPEKKSNSFLLTAVSYLTGIKSKASEAVFVQLMTDKNKTLALASIRALAKIEATGRVGEILKIYKDAETDVNFKPDIIWALGEMKARDAVDPLLKEYEESDNEPLLQGTILAALGKIGDARAWNLVQTALDSDNSDLRAAAVGTLGSFPGHFELATDLTKALRDAQVNVRLAGADAAGTLKIPELQEILLFRVKKDPEARVRTACLRALAAYDGGATPVLALLSDRKTDFSVWREALNQAIDKKWSGVSEALQKVLDEENKAKNGALAPVIAGALLPTRDSYRTLFGVLLLNDSVTSRSLALRAIAAGNFREYEPVVRNLSVKDPDVNIKAQATAILKTWTATP